MSKLGHDDLFTSIRIAHLYGAKKYSKPQELYSLTNPFYCKHGWKIPFDSMAKRLNFNA